MVPRSIRPDDEILAGCLHDFFGDDRELVGDENMFDLHHETLNQTYIASRDAKNGGNGLLVGKIIGMRGHPMTPSADSGKHILILC